MIARLLAAVLPALALADLGYAQSPVIHRYAAAAPGLFVNAYLVETANGVVAIDGMLTETDSKGLRAKVDSIGKPLVAVLLTHGHPDHYNGVTNLVAGRSVPVLATAGVDSVIRADDAAKEQQWGPRFKNEWPRHRTFPTRVVRDGEMVAFDGARFTVHALGPGESKNDSYWVLQGQPVAAFIGDVVLNHVHAYTADGHTTEWLVHLRRLRNVLPANAALYPGHGDPGGREMLEWQRRYLVAYRDAVADLSGGRAALDDSAEALLVARMREYLPSDRLEFLIGFGADPVAAELARKRRRP